jgi:hypothetical protein
MRKKTFAKATTIVTILMWVIIIAFTMWFIVSYIDTLSNIDAGTYEYARWNLIDIIYGGN